ncbi:MAG: hypothetical protein FJ102_20215 [Deltaproteobacteria bacterium]|nr:hypothetical protein [Deltaproteobacteria bacterium]
MNQRAAILTVPVVFGSAMILAAGGWFLAVRTTSGEARGEPFAIAVPAGCNRVAIENRLADYGLPYAWNGDTLTVTLAGTPGDEGFARALLAPGELRLVSGSEVLAARVVNAGVQVSFSGAAISLFTLDRGLPADIVVTLDGVAIEIESVNGNELQVAARGATSTEALRVATDRVVAVRWPGACPPSIVP